MLSFFKKLNPEIQHKRHKHTHPVLGLFRCIWSMFRSYFSETAPEFVWKCTKAHLFRRSRSSCLVCIKVRMAAFILFQMNQTNRAIKRFNQTKPAKCEISLWHETIKGLLHPKIKILSLITYPHVVPNPFVKKPVQKSFVRLRNTN